ncbi:MAG TPA: sugar phosphate nucleotidyltransferase [Pyrinomonadaceae bacterium]|nr:sugar phosphate nucleotidyltransferase [Pyrinomonadaceae bacterium]
MKDIELKKIEEDSRVEPVAINDTQSNRWAVILAGGDGTRLRSLTRVIAGDERPKQFCRIFGAETLLDQTVRRVSLSVLTAQTFFALTESHKEFYKSLLAHVPCERKIVQPSNQGTAPAILYSLMRLAEINPHAAVAFFPSDHYFNDDATFMSHVEKAFEAVQARQDLIVLLGITPTSPEVEYGWIEPSSSISLKNASALSRVRRFWEKPSKAHARLLFEQGCLWNSFVMVGRVQEFLHLFRRTLPELYQAFARVRPTFGTGVERRAVRALYNQIPQANFSHQVLSACPNNLAVLPVGGVEWSDWGAPERVFSTLARIGAEVEWLQQAV